MLAVINDKPIRQYKLDELIIKLSELINKTHVNCGMVYKEENFVPTIELLATDLVMEYGALTFGELEIAFKRGWKSNYKFYGLSNVTFFKWVKRYADDESRLRAKKAILNIQNSLALKPHELTEEEKEKKIKELVLFLFNQFKNGSLCIIPSTVYDYLQRRVIINYSPELKEKFMAQAKTELAEEASEQRFNNRTKDAINNYLQALADGGNIDVINRAKAIAVKHWYERIITMDEDINELLK